MQAALSLARRGLGNVWPNPAVGCLILRDGLVVGRGWTQPGGRPHAETEALRRAGTAARGATCYVTLEPCAHHGRTPPCADALIEAGVARVVVGAGDPDPRVDGRGQTKLREAGIAVEIGVCAEAAAALNAGFIGRVAQGRPLVALKAATSLDGRIATASGESQWITGPQARQRGHLLRACHDAILIGSGTLEYDDPSLTCRLPGLEHRSPVRVVLDSEGRIPAGAAILRDAGEVPVWVVTADPDALQGRLPAGAEAIGVSRGGDGKLDMTAVLSALAQRGITRLLVEGGAGVATTLLRDGLVDRLYWFRAPLLIGGAGLPLFGDLEVEALSAASRLRYRGCEQIGQDVLEIYDRQS